MKIRHEVCCVAVLLAGVVMGRAESMPCNGDSNPPAQHAFDRKSTDVVQPNHLEVRRAFAADGNLEVSVCNASVRVEARPGTEELHVLVNVGEKQSHPLEDYVQTLRVDRDHAVVQLKLPKGANATVLVQVPMGPGSKTELGIGRGSLDFEGAGAAGDREIDVGMGDARLALGGVSSYAHMEINVGMGSFHDHRQGGTSGHFATSRTLDGTGQGKIEVNVGMGSLDIVN